DADARPTRNAPSVAANAIELLPDAYDMMRKKKISYERHTRPPRHEISNTTPKRVRIAGVVAANAGSGARTAGARASPPIRCTITAVTATAAFIAAATPMLACMPSHGNSATAAKRQAAPAPSVF